MSIKRTFFLLFTLFVPLLLGLWGATAPTAHAAPLTVYPGEVAIDENGRCSLREAIINANNDAATHPDCPTGTGDDTIIIPAGTYILDDATTPGENFSVTGDLDLRSNITLQGAGAGSTILDGNSTDRVLHVISGAVAIVNDVTIRNGLTPDGANASTGCASSSSSCLSTGGDGIPGGGILNEGTLTLNRVLITDNETGAGGDGGELTCSSSAICTTIGGDGGRGAGVHSTGPSLTIHNSVIQHNHSGAGGEAGADNCTGGAICSQGLGLQGPGGGIDSRTGNTLTVTLSRITHNSGGQGGGIYCVGACTITHSAIEDNIASNIAGGLFLNHNSPKTVSHTTVANNTAAGNGGGIYANIGSVTLSNVTISGNASNLFGGGLVNIIANTTLNHVSIANNTADSDDNGTGDGGGIFRTEDGQGVPQGTLNLKNSVVANNVDTGGQAPDCGGAITSQLYNHIGSLTGCDFTPGTGDVTGSDPELGLLADNGGLGQTHRPNVGSPLLTLPHRIPNGVNDCGDVITLDQRGAARPFGGSCAKGAVEVRETITVGNCGGADLAGVHNFPFSSDNTVSLNVMTNDDGLKCVSAEEMGANHPAATGAPGDAGIHTGNWWHISGNVDSGFTMRVTLPHAVTPDGNAMVCKFPGTQWGYGWDCDRTSSDADTVWLDGVDSFSDWAVGNEVGPTAVTRLTQQTSTPTSALLPIVLVTLFVTLTSAWLWFHRKTT